ncbi:hypothetical protein SEA_VANLEE_134 [Gordonia phage VanLee]|uniref:Uncharacterized protein n=1 Tax=Gordonia phage VanLee TaxID=2845816 RepID=A0A8F2D9J4_9CAUD|nr:hypothetical protein QEH49_gp156 [Gordonia phage VanLee]QWS68250.1 hypothetical protein SEA_VANLEE_134 [Gordonia phage VanLee]
MFTKISATLAAAAAAVTIGAGAAGAVTVDEYDVVRQTFCSTSGATIDLTYHNEYGNTVTKSGTWLDGSSKNGVTCINRDIRAGEYGDYISTTISADERTYVYCALWVEGVKVAEASDNSKFLPTAMCY